MLRAFALIAFSFLAATAHAVPPFPKYFSSPVPVNAADANYENYGQYEFTLRDKTEVKRGHYWHVYADYTQKLGDDPRRALGAFVDAMQKAGWQVVLRDEPRNPPLATFHYTKDGKDAWASIVTSEQVRIDMVEGGVQPARIDLPTPDASSAKAPDNADFPALKHYGSAKLAGTTHDDSPFLVQIDEDKEPVQVASGFTVKEYAAQDLGSIEPIVAYSDALKRAGWTIVEENIALTTGDPYLTAHYVKGTVDLWAHVHSRGAEGYLVRIADAGAEKGAAKLKAQLDKTCKVPLYGLNFDFDKATLRADSEAALNAILAFLNTYPDLAVELAGHTDNVGKPDYNAKLSDARVNTVRGWLVGKGVKADRLTAKGYGDSQPVATNDSPEGRAKNRRVEMRKRGC